MRQKDCHGGAFIEGAGGCVAETVSFVSPISRLFHAVHAGTLCNVSRRSNSGRRVELISAGLGIFGVVGGFALRCLHSYKLLLPVGLGIRLVFVRWFCLTQYNDTHTSHWSSGIALMVHSCGVQGSVAEFVWTQILQGMGGGLALTCCLVSLQASVSHVDVAITTAWALMSNSIGTAVGTAVGMLLRLA